jgi:hypothetical protein
VKKASAAPRAAVRVAASAPSAGVSVVVDEDVHGCPRELAYARVTGIHARVSATGDSLETLREAEGSFALRRGASRFADAGDDGAADGVLRRRAGRERALGESLGGVFRDERPRPTR